MWFLWSVAHAAQLQASVATVPANELPGVEWSLSFSGELIQEVKIANPYAEGWGFQLVLTGKDATGSPLAVATVVSNGEGPYVKNAVISTAQIPAASLDEFIAQVAPGTLEMQVSYVEKEFWRYGEYGVEHQWVSRGPKVLASKSLSVTASSLQVPVAQVDEGLQGLQSTISTAFPAYLYQTAAGFPVDSAENRFEMAVAAELMKNGMTPYSKKPQKLKGQLEWKAAEPKVACGGTWSGESRCFSAVTAEVVLPVSAMQLNNPTAGVPLVGMFAGPSTEVESRAFQCQWRDVWVSKGGAWTAERTMESPTCALK